ncbi:MAG: cytochrome c3 family protein [Candidatus Thiodiazotropha sp.]
MSSRQLGNKLALIACMLLFLQQAPPVNAQLQSKKERSDLLSNPASIPKLLSDKQLSKEQIPNPHWRPEACVSCHTKKPTKNNLHLRSTDIDKLCNQCHEALTRHETIHPVGMQVSADMKAFMPPGFRNAVDRKGGSLGCAACHELPIQCLPTSPYTKKRNAAFLRGGTSQDRTAQCYHCHNPDQYARLNPHDLIDKNGKLRFELCLICHKKTPNPETAAGIADVSFVVSHDLSNLCTRCHQKVPHPGGSVLRSRAPADHLVVPVSPYLERMNDAQKQRNLTLPLDPNTGKIFCATCHNPHPKGVLRKVETGKDTVGRHWLRTTNICTVCHDI